MGKIHPYKDTSDSHPGFYVFFPGVLDEGSSVDINVVDGVDYPVLHSVPSSQDLNHPRLHRQVLYLQALLLSSCPVCVQADQIDSFMCRLNLGLCPLFVVLSVAIRSEVLSE